ncbi:MAG: PD-(D/E)XK nuclease family protein, partial [Lachnospira sp.]|nr:PD-(D/E)XK nuclease family protein [Lachnospira sp.]
MYVIKGNVIKISVRSLVEFLCRTGDIDNRSGGMSDIKLMQEGAKLHKKIQKSMGAAYHAEVPLKIEIPKRVEDIDYLICLEGRADGIISNLSEDGEGNKEPLSEVTIDEIKTTQQDTEKLKEAVYVHKAQAMCYGYIYMQKHELEKISIQMTYCNAETEKIKRFVQEYSREELTEWFETLIDSFKLWSDFLFAER